jgi:hypothetical protein
MRDLLVRLPAARKKEKRMKDRESIQSVIEAHVAAEFRRDYETAVATLHEEIRYEFPLQRAFFAGRENAFRFYSFGSEERYRKATNGDSGLPASGLLHQWFVENARISETSAYSVMSEDGLVHTYPVLAIIVAGPDGILVERIYVGDEMYRLLTSHVADAIRPMG